VVVYVQTRNCFVASVTVHIFIILRMKEALVCKRGQALIYNEWVAQHKYFVQSSTTTSNCWEVVMKEP